MVGEICTAAAAEIDNAVRPTTLRSEISRWAESASWGEQMTRALKLIVNTNQGVKISKDWYGEFFAAMDRTGGNAAEACEIAAIGQSVVLALIDSRNKCYDPEFHERFRIAESTRVGAIREKFFRKAESDEVGSLKAQMSILETQMPDMHGKSSNLRVSGEVDHAHSHMVTVGLAKEIVQASQSRVRALSAGRGVNGNGGSRASGGYGRNPAPWVVDQLKQLEAERGGGGVQVADIVEAEYAEVGA